jgi:hypothetical protein
MEVGVQITGHLALPGTETTFTENVSSRGARVLSTRRWKIYDQLTIASTSRKLASPSASNSSSPAAVGS